MVFGAIPNGKHLETDIKLSTQPNGKKALDFMILGDWGYKPIRPYVPILGYLKDDSDPQRGVANAMIQLADQPNDHTQFVITTGDNMYRSEGYILSDGVSSTSDGRFNRLWKDMYLKNKLVDKPWFLSIGNHDFLGNPEAQVEYSDLHPLWNMPALFWHTTVKLEELNPCPDDSCIPKAAYIFIDTNFLYYGYSFSNLEGANMWYGFRQRGMTSDETGDDQLKWIEDRLIEYKDYAYIFVVGHHPLGQRREKMRMAELDALVQKYKVTGYLYGHIHELGLARREDTLYVLSGAGSHNHHLRSTENNGPADYKFGIYGQLGFARGEIREGGFRVSYYTDENVRIHQSDPIPPRRSFGSFDSTNSDGFVEII